MKIAPKLFMACALLFASFYACAQTDTAKTAPPEKDHFKIGFNFLSNNVFLGRVDSVSTPSLTPKLSYTFKSGIYLSGSMDIITNRKKNKLDGGEIELGYDYTKDDNLEFGASFTKLFFNSTSTQVDASISSELNGYVDYNIADIITPNLSLTYQIGKSGVNGDFLINPSLSHEFLIESVFGDNDKLTISPEAGLNYGSQNFYSGYLERKGKISRKGVNATYNSYIDALGTYSLLDYELTMPVVYKTGGFSISIIPSIAFAKENLPTSTAADKLITESIQKTAPVKPNVFYLSAGLAYRF